MDLILVRVDTRGLSTVSLRGGNELILAAEMSSGPLLSSEVRKQESVLSTGAHLGSAVSTPLFSSSLLSECLLHKHTCVKS